MAVPPADRPCAVIREGAAGNVAGLCVFIAQDLLSAPLSEAEPAGLTTLAISRCTPLRHV
jgi:hypothetical protein